MTAADGLRASAKSPREMTDLVGSEQVPSGTSWVAGPPGHGPGNSSGEGVGSEQVPGATSWVAGPPGHGPRLVPH